MPAITLDPSLSLQPNKNLQHGIVEQIEGLIKVYKDGYVERPQIVLCVTCVLAPDLSVTLTNVVMLE